MLPVLTVAQVRAAEAELFTTVPADSVMQRAAAGLAQVCVRLLNNWCGGVAGARVYVLVGSGNNGGDALFAAAELARRGARVICIQVGERLHTDGAAAARRAGARVIALQDVGDLGDADLVLDGIVGIGGRGGIDPAIGALVTTATEALVVAVDVPSGVDADTGEVTNSAIRADVTVTFGALKPGVTQAAEFVGEIELVDIGLPIPDEVSTVVFTGSDAALYFPEPELRAHKYSRGVVGIAAGSRAYPGAAVLVVAGARHANIGMVIYRGDSQELAAQVVARYPDVVLSSASPSDLTRISSWACGSGFTDDQLTDVEQVLATDLPVVLDAGALALLTQHDHLRTRVQERGALTVITPHDGEFTRLFPNISLTDRIGAASAAARQLGAVVVLKGPATVLADPAGEVRIDLVGGAELACAGSGDVLAGIIGSVLAAGVARAQDVGIDHVAAACWVHGIAGGLAAAVGRTVTAVDIAAEVSAAIAAARSGDHG